MKYWAILIITFLVEVLIISTLGGTALIGPIFSLTALITGIVVMLWVAWHDEVVE